MYQIEENNFSKVRPKSNIYSHCTEIFGALLTISQTFRERKKNRVRKGIGNKETKNERKVAKIGIFEEIFQKIKNSEK